MAPKLSVTLVLLVFLAGILAALFAPAPVYAVGHTAPTPTPTPLQAWSVKVGSNAHLAIGALVLVVIILFGVLVNVRRKK